MKRRPTFEERALGAARQVSHGAGQTPLAARAPSMPTPTTARPAEVFPISNPGAMSPGRSTPWHVIRGGQAIVTVIVARTPASGDSTFQWRVNDVLTGDVITLPSGAPSVPNIQAISVVPGDILDLECLTAGTGLADVGGRGEING